MKHLMFQLVFRPTKSENKFDTNEAHFLMGDRESVFRMWWELHKVAGWPHVEIQDMDGNKQQPEKGLSGLSGLTA